MRGISAHSHCVYNFVLENKLAKLAMNMFLNAFCSVFLPLFLRMFTTDASSTVFVTTVNRVDTKRFIV
jgi:hypothetical protein